jgi:homoserine O-succinyltransferase
VDWAEEHTISTVWSCLAAHAAVLHIDGVGRIALPEKLFGVFECKKASDLPVLAGAPSRWCVPHSRYNGLSEDALVSRGYHTLSRSPDAGVDMFVKERKSLFFFLQGHPEYDAGALLREYRRDISDFLAGERDSYPEMPRGYFGHCAAASLGAFRQRARRNRSADLLSSFPAAEVKGKSAQAAWRETAVLLYTNWLSYLRKPDMQRSWI